MRQMSVGEANEQFLKLVREVTDTGEEVILLHDGKPIAKIVSAHVEGKRTLTATQQRALNSFESARSSTYKSDRPWTREELYDRE